LVGRNQPPARFIARGGARTPRQLEQVWGCTAQSTAGRITAWVGFPWSPGGVGGVGVGPTGVAVAVAAAQPVKNGNWALVGIGRRWSFGSLKLGLVRQRSEPSSRREKMVFVFVRRVRKFGKLQPGLGKASPGMKRCLGQRRKAHKISNLGSSGVGAPNKPINANWQAGFYWSWLSLRNFQNSGIRRAPCQSRYRRSLGCCRRV